MVAESGFGAAVWDNGAGKLPEADVAVIDGYRFDKSLPARWKEQAGTIVVMVDDNGDRPIVSDGLLNHNLYGADVDYNAYRYAKLMAGSQFALIEPGFVKLVGEKRIGTPRFMVSFGGTDDGAYAAVVAEALLGRSSNIVIDLPISSFVEPSSALLQLEKKWVGRVRIHRGALMVELMAKAKVYIGAGGVTAIEAIAAGLDIVTCAIAPNQNVNVQLFRTMGYAAFNSFQPVAMAEAAIDRLTQPRDGFDPIVDGRGADRVVDGILGLIGERRDVRRSTE